MESNAAVPLFTTPWAMEAAARGLLHHFYGSLCLPLRSFIAVVRTRRLLRLVDVKFYEIVYLSIGDGVLTCYNRLIDKLVLAVGYISKYLDIIVSL